MILEILEYDFITIFAAVLLGIVMDLLWRRIFES
jgi:hypothetical protein